MIVLSESQAKVALAAMLEWQDANGASTSTLTDRTIATLARGLFGENGRHVTSYDAPQLRNEAYSAQHSCKV